MDDLNTNENGYQNPVSAVVLPPRGNVGPMPQANVETQNAPNDGQLQAPPAASPVSVTSPQPALPPGSSFRHLAPALIGAVLGHIAGTPGPSYSVDETGKTIATPPPPMSTGDKIKRIAEHALVGLAASGNVPEQKSGLASALSGFGAGANAVGQQQQQQDKAARDKANEDFEQEQRTKLRQHEILKQNALTMATHYGNIKAQNELTPVFAQNESLFNAVKNSTELGVHATEMTDEQVKQEAEKNPEFAHTHIIKPLGWEPVTDPEGNPVMTQDAEGNQTPKEQMRMAVIDATKDGKIAVTPGMAADFKKYAEKARVSGAEQIKAGDEYELSQLIPLMNKIDEQKKAELQGWAKPQLVFGGADGKTPLMYNPYNGEMREFPEGVTPNVANKPAESGAKVKKDESTAAKNKAGAAKAGGTDKRSADRLALQQAGKSAELDMKAAQAGLTAALQTGKRDLIGAAQAKFDAAAQSYKDATSKLGPSAGTHVFDSKSWAAANPGKDLNAAIAQAKAQGYEVK